MRIVPFLLFLFISSFPLSYCSSIVSCSQLVTVALNDPGVSYQLSQDIDCINVPMFPLGNESHLFMGEIDGKDYAIRNVRIISGNSNPAIFYGGSGCRIKNLALKNITVDTTNGYIIFFFIIK